MTDDKQFKLWDKWLGSIYDDVQRLVIGRHVYGEVARIVADNPKIQKPSSFYELMGSTFLAWSAMAVRRQAESLGRLLGEIKGRPEVLSRERFVRIYVDGWGAIAPYADATSELTPENLLKAGTHALTRDEIEALANLQYDRCVATNASRIDPLRVSEEIQELRDKTEKVERFASKRIAHLVNRATKPPSLSELDECVTYLEKIVTGYKMLFRASAPIEMLPTWQYDWRAIFNEPWLPRP